MNRKFGFTLKDAKVEKALDEVDEELAEATENYPPMRNYHEGYAVILEELDELWDEIKKRPTERDAKSLRNEARQVAAMALRFMVDLT
jgi:hypothetical protein